MKNQVKPNRGVSYALQENRTSRTSELEYLADILPQLRQMALSLDEKTLAYLLEMAMLEAELVLNIDLENASIQHARKQTT